MPGSEHLPHSKKRDFLWTLTSLSPLLLICPGHHGQNNKVCAQHKLLLPVPGKGFQMERSRAFRAVTRFQGEQSLVGSLFLLGTNKPGSQVLSLDQHRGCVEAGAASQEPCPRNFTLLPDRSSPYKCGQGRRRRRLGWLLTSLGFCRVTSTICWALGNSPDL